MAGSSILGFVQRQYSSVVDRAIAEALQNQEEDLLLTSDEEIARQLQEMENLFINSIPDEISHNIPITDVVPVEIPSDTVSWGTPDNNHVHEGSGNHDVSSDDGNNEHNDPDNMSYEELQSLTEEIGSENIGLSEETIASLPVSVYKNGFFSKKKQSCTICLAEFRNREMIISLQCKHDFHKDCITKWLADHKIRMYLGVGTSFMTGTSCLMVSALCSRIGSKMVCPICRYEIEETA